MKDKIGWSIAKWSVILIGTAAIIGPILLIVINSFKSLQDAASDFFGWPNTLYLDNCTQLFTDSKFWKYMTNSVGITFISLLLVVLIVPMVSYAIARNFERRYYKALYYYMVIGLFVPFQIIMLPLVKEMTKLGLMNRLGVIVIYASTAVSQGVFLFVSYIRAMPVEMEEAANIDGCSATATYFKIVFPLIKPMVSTLIVIDALWFWNDFQLPLLLLNKNPDFWTLPIFQYNFKSVSSFNYTMAFAAYLTCLIPIVIIYIFCQKHIINGLTAGAVKN